MGLYSVLQRYNFESNLQQYNMELDRQKNCIQYYKDTILYLQPIITQYFIDNKSEIWSLSLITHSKG